LNHACKAIEHQRNKISELTKELEKAADYLLEEEEKLSSANLTALDLLAQLKEADMEIENLKQ
jgi:hypothetical protein